MWHGHLQQSDVTIHVSLGGLPDLRTPLAFVLVIRKREDSAILCHEAEGTQDFKQITQTSWSKTNRTNSDHTWMTLHDFSFYLQTETHSLIQRHNHTQCNTYEYLRMIGSHSPSTLSIFGGVTSKLPYSLLPVVKTWRVTAEDCAC